MNLTYQESRAQLSALLVLFYQLCLLAIAKYLFGDIKAALLVALSLAVVVIWQIFFMSKMSYTQSLVFSLLSFLFLCLLLNQTGFLICFILASIFLFFLFFKKQKPIKKIFIFFCLFYLFVFCVFFFLKVYSTVLLVMLIQTDL